MATSLFAQIDTNWTSAQKQYARKGDIKDTIHIRGLDLIKVDTSNGNVGIGVSSPTRKLDVNGDLKVTGSGTFVGTSLSILNYLVGSSHPVLDLNNSRGVSGSGIYLLNGDEVGAVVAREGTSGNYAGGTGIRIFASENWSDTSLGADMYLFTTKNGTTTKSNAVIIENDGDVQIVYGNLILSSGNIVLPSGNWLESGGGRILQRSSGAVYLGDIDGLGGSIYIREDGIAAISIAGNNVGIGSGATVPTNKLDIDGNSIRIRSAKTPSSATDTGVQGTIAWDSNYIYICIATNTWKRAAISTW